MVHEVNGVVAIGRGDKVSVETILVPDPGPGERPAVGGGPVSARIEHLETSGTFCLDGGAWEVSNNVWLVGDDIEVVVIDPAHDAEAVLETVGDRALVGVLCTHGHNDHINAAAEVADKSGGPTGHTWGSVSLYAPELGATGRSYSHFPTIIESIQDRLLTLPAGIVVHTGHGPTTTIGAEAPHLDDWIARGF